MERKQTEVRGCNQNKLTFQSDSSLEGAVITEEQIDGDNVTGVTRTNEETDKDESTLEKRKARAKSVTLKDEAKTHGKSGVLVPKHFYTQGVVITTNTTANQINGEYHKQPMRTYSILKTHPAPTMSDRS